MKPFAPLAICSLALVGVVAVNAQGGLRPKPALMTASFDYHLVHSAKYTYRYDSKTGATQRFVIDSVPGAVKYSWAGILDTAATPTPGDAGRYEVVEGSGDTGQLVRIDTATGRTWMMVSAPLASWQEVAK